MKIINKKNRGFTMIELIIVIAILGILAAFALPRFANFSTEAKSAAREGIASSLNSAIAITHAKWIAAGSSSTNLTVTLDGAPSAIILNSLGYPDVGGTINSQVACQTLVNNLVTGNASTLVVDYSGTACTVNGTSGWATPITLTPQSAI